LGWVEEFGDDKIKYRFYFQLVEHCAGIFEKFEETMEYAEKMARLGEDCYIRIWGNGYERLRTYEFVARGLYEEVIDYEQQTVEAAKMEEANVADALCNSLWRLAMAYEGLGRWNESLKSCQDILALGIENSKSTRIIQGRAVLGRVYASMGEWRKVITECEAAMSMSPSDCIIPWIVPQLGEAYCRTGQVDRGMKLLEQRKSYAKRVGRGAIVECEYCLPLAEGYLAQGDIDKARENADEALQIALEQGYAFHEAKAHRILGEILASTDLKSAENHFSRSLAIMQRIKARNEEGKTELSWGRACKQHGDMEQARAHLTRAAEIFQELGTTRYLEWTREALDF
jgi:tetratricopeptide (TPR) repeat protein